MSTRDTKGAKPTNQPERRCLLSFGSTAVPPCGDAGASSAACSQCWPRSADAAGHKPGSHAPWYSACRQTELLASKPAGAWSVATSGPGNWQCLSSACVALEPVYLRKNYLQYVYIWTHSKCYYTVMTSCWVKHLFVSALVALTSLMSRPLDSCL